MGTDLGVTTDMVGLTEIQRRVIDHIDQEVVIEFHRSLVRVPSVNPPGDVREAMDLVRAPLDDAGYHTRLLSDLDIMPNLIATHTWSEGPVVGFNAHLDVVPIGDRAAWTHDPFGAEIANGRIYGRGAGDDKGSVAAQVMAAVALKRSGVSLKGTLIVNEVADEEVGGVHGAALMVHGNHFKPDFMIVGEQTMNEVALGEKGSAGMEIVVRGRTAHGALPWEGANAIEAIAEIIVALRTHYYPVVATRTNPYFHPSSASVNMISGGVKANVVPDFASIVIDRRLVPGEDPAEVRAEMAEVARGAVSGMEGISVSFSNPLPGGNATMMPEDSPLVLAMQGANAALGLSQNLRGFSMATDGRFFAANGVPTIIYGPGDPKLAHIPDEWIGIDEVIQATRAYALTALALLGSQD